MFADEFMCLIKSNKFAKYFSLFADVNSLVMITTLTESEQSHGAT